MNSQIADKNNDLIQSTKAIGLENLGVYPDTICRSAKPRPKRLSLDLQMTKKWKSRSCQVKFKLDEHYDVIKTLGSGTYASVKLATCLNDNKQVAVKISRRINSCEKLASEYKILSELDHDCIIKPLKFITNEMKQEAYLVLEYFEGTDLKEFVQQNGPLSVEDTLKVVHQLSSCVAYLHSKGVAHRDIKPENVLIDADLNIKLIDFNISKKMKSGSIEDGCKFSSVFYTQISSPLYAAPEIKENLLYTESVDIWGIGIIMFTCIYGCSKSKCNYSKAFDQNRMKETVEFDSLLHDQVKDLLSKMLCEDPQLRLTADEILSNDSLITPLS
ncbi:unnamed protein product [Moneuplotes crassus]|uniref:Protein kinase domain-containing protein n=1 Tax=Euplotes crassus TaxID=5936 RepID=A0AAD1U788_EUPCR|nr:unnamed protein product [Moneuplotes crassus]